jgi:putative membrane protein insertion efficiency factor
MSFGMHVKNIPRSFAILLIKGYQKFKFTAPSCKFYPCCSEYSKQAYIQKGFIKGSALMVWRLLRCNPISKGGVDFTKIDKTVLVGKD